jgi:ATP-dependent DNA ligase
VVAADRIPPWRRIPPRLVCDVRVSNLNAGGWARFPVFLRWRTDPSPDDCRLDQLQVWQGDTHVLQSPNPRHRNGCVS